MRVFLRFPEGKAKALTFSYDDGAAHDRRLVEIFNQNGLKGTFNLYSSVLGDEKHVGWEELRSLYVDAGHEVAVHTETHPFLEELPAKHVLYEVFENRRRLEDATGTIVRGMAYPYGTFNDRIVNVLKSAGMLYSRTTVSTEDFRLPEDFLRLPATCHHNNPRLFELAERFTASSPNEQSQHRPWLFYVWGHSYEFPRDNNWDRIERFAETVGGRDDVWYATNVEIFEYINAYRQLECSVDGGVLQNLSAQDVWLEADGALVRVPAGQTVKL